MAGLTYRDFSSVNTEALLHQSVGESEHLVASFWNLFLNQLNFVMITNTSFILNVTIYYTK